MLFKNGQLREKYRSLSPNSLRVLAWQEDQYERPLRIAKYKEKQKRKMADRAESNSSSSSRKPRSRSPRKRAKPSHDDSDEEDPGCDEEAEALDPTLTRDAFSAAISLNSQPVPDLRTTAQVQQISPSLSRSSRVSPTRQSTTYSRTPSPSKGGLRQKRIVLKYTTPKFYSGLPSLPDLDDDTIDELAEISGLTTLIPPRVHFEIPPHIASIVNSLSETSATQACIPSSLSTAIHTLSHGTEPIPQEAYSSETQTPYPHITPPQLLRHIKDIYTSAQNTYDAHQDESAWYPLVRHILAGPVSSAFLKIDEAQSRVVATELLPVAGQARVPIATVKVDQVVQIDAAHGQVARLLDPLFESEPDLSLSAFNDPVASKTFTAAIVEVKSPGGDYDEGVYQLTVASAAVLERLRGLESGGAEMGKGGGNKDWNEEMPVLGWVVHGHFWYLHVTYRQHDGSIVNPLPFLFIFHCPFSPLLPLLPPPILFLHPPI